MYILTMIIMFYGTNALQAVEIKQEYSSVTNCEDAAKKNTLSLKATGDEGKVVMATCTLK